MAKNRPKKAAFKKTQKKRLHKMSGYKCQICGRGAVGGSCRNDGDALKPHHIIPHCKGGLTTEVNCAMVCQKCHAELHSLAIRQESKGEVRDAIKAFGLEGKESLVFFVNAGNSGTLPEMSREQRLQIYADLCR
jgi:5-methylcytosine-specific restriction endonuclease McrA